MKNLIFSLIASFLLILSGPSLLANDPPENNGSITCASGSRSCITEDKGILKGGKTKAAIQTVNWLLLTASLMGCIMFGIKASKKLSDEQYVGALGPGLGSMLCGLMGFIAYTIMS